MRANRLQGALGSAGQGADGFEILVSTPSAGQGWESDVDNLGSSHSVSKSATCTGLWFERTGVEVVLGGRKSEAFFFPWCFSAGSHRPDRLPAASDGFVFSLLQEF